ncbi:MAG TPA: hypothetical protein VHN14_32040 [Kofleriaceae bacterium]|nr:hypothetical protein [Kofleriaceae bacterium]
MVRSRSGPERLPCTTAALGEHLEVYALAPDGWESYFGNDDADNRAFALAPV